MRIFACLCRKVLSIGAWLNNFGVFFFSGVALSLRVHVMVPSFSSAPFYGLCQFDSLVYFYNISLFIMLYLFNR